MSKKEEELARKQLELDSKSKQIFKLELEISKVKFSAYKSKPKLAICNVANQNIPPPARIPSPPKPPIPKLSCVTLKSTWDTPECRNRTALAFILECQSLVMMISIEECSLVKIVTTHKEQEVSPHLL